MYLKRDITYFHNNKPFPIRSLCLVWVWEYFLYYCLWYFVPFLSVFYAFLWHNLVLLNLIKWDMWLLQVISFWKAKTSQNSVESKILISANYSFNVIQTAAAAHTRLCQHIFIFACQSNSPCVCVVCVFVYVCVCDFKSEY